MGLDPEPDLLALDALDDDFDGTINKKRPHRGGQRQACRWLDFEALAGFSIFLTAFLYSCHTEFLLWPQMLRSPIYLYDHRNLDVAFLAQHVDTDVVRMASECEVDHSITNP